MELQKRYGLPMAICMVVGIVIGSGVFFKAQTMLQRTGGDMLIGVLAWAIGGAIMLVCALTFAKMAAQYEKVNGVVDYAEACVGKTYAYIVAWTMTMIYSPSLVGVVGWLTARYTLTFLASVNPGFVLSIPVSEGGAATSPECLALTMIFICLAYAINALSPKLAGKVQISATVIKLIPLILMAVVGIIYGLSNGITQENFMHQAAEVAPGVLNNPLFMGVVASSFAYEGWIIATSINAELRNAKRNMPLALIFGSIIVIVVYIAYFIGLAGGASVDNLMAEGATVAFTNIFGNVVGNILNLFIAVSCFGALNGLMLGACRGMYSMAARNQGPKVEVFRAVDAGTNMPTNSAIVGLLLSAGWAAYFFLANMTPEPTQWFGSFIFDSSELPVITIYALYIPIFFLYMKNKVAGWKGKILPVLAIFGCLFMMLACAISHKMANVYYLIVFAVILAIGLLVKGKSSKI